MRSAIGRSFAVRFLRGFWCVPRAVGMIAASPRILLWSALPFLLCLALYVAFFSTAVLLADDVVGRIIQPGSWWREALRWALMLAIPLAVLVVSVFTYALACFVIAAPLYEWLSASVERRLTGRVEEAPTSVRLMLADVWRALADAVRIFVMEMAVLLLGFVFVPVSSVLAALASGVLLALGYCDYPMGRRRMLFADRLRYAWRHRWEMLGLGLPLLFALTVPLVGVAFLPVGVVAGTILFVELPRPDCAEAGGVLTSGEEGEG